MTIRKKMWIGFGAVTLIIVVIGGIGFWGISNETREMDDLSRSELPFFQVAKEIKIEMLQHRRYEKDYFLNIGNSEKQAGYLKKFEEKSQSIIAKMGKLRELSELNSNLSKEFKHKLLSLLDLYRMYYQGVRSVSRPGESRR